ncbi:MAG TPA: hypothetical protein VK034_17760, partial [Enhygromyxa sp.]|nr:hypothetical protein [Enhygromyxa sp.]
MTSDRPLAEALIVEPGSTCLDPSLLRGEVESWRDSDRVDRRVIVRVWGSSRDARSLDFAVEVEGEIVV